MKTKIKTILITIFCAFMFVSLSFGMGSNKAPIMRVGAAIALTGYGAQFGESENNAISMLKEKYANEKIEFYIEDNKSNPKDGLAAVNKLINIHGVDVVYCDLTTVSNAINPILASKGVIHIASVYLRSLLDSNEFAIRNLPTGRYESKLLLTYLKKEGIELNKTAILVSNDEFGNSSSLDFKKELENFNGSVVYESTFPELPMLKSEIAKLLITKPLVVYIASLYPHVGNAVKELRIQGYGGKIISTDVFPYPSVINAAGTYAKGAIYVDFPGTEKYKDLKINYKKRFGVELLPTTILCHDGLSFIINLMKNKGNKSLADYISTWNDKTYNGIYGELKIINREIKYPLKVKVW